MDEKYLEALEFDKIRARAADGIVCPEARGMLLGQPAWETPDEVRAALEQTDAMTTLLIKNGSPRFSSVENVRGIVQRAEKGGVLSMAELLTVADTLRNFRELVKWSGLMDELRKLEKDKQLNASQRAARAREIAKKETEKLFGKTDVVHAPQRTFKPLDSVKLGQEVLIAELDKPGIVTALPDRDGLSLIHI